MFHCRTSFKQEIGQIKSLAPLQVELTQTEIDGMKELSNRAFQHILINESKDEGKDEQ